jgi:hypothetical protein
MVPSPERKTVAAAVDEPPFAREEGGKTITAVSRTGGTAEVGVSPSSVGVSSFSGGG